MGDWINGTCHSLTAIYYALRKDVVYSVSKYLMADETSIKVLDTEMVKGRKGHAGFIWNYCNPVDRLVFFEYQKGLANKHMRPMLDNFRGILHTDGMAFTSTTVMARASTMPSAMPTPGES